MTRSWPAYDRVIAQIRQYDSTQAGNNTHVRYVKLDIVVCRPVGEASYCCLPYCTTKIFALDLMAQFHHQLDGNWSDDSQEIDTTEVGQLVSE